MPTLTATEETTYTLTSAGLAALDAEVTVNESMERGDAPAGTEAASDTFYPDTAEKVDWVLSKIAGHRAAATRIWENAELMAREADRAAEGLEWQYGPALQAFCRKETEGGRKKSVRLFHGVLGYRTKPARITVGDETAAIAWAKSNLPLAVMEKLDTKALADALLSRGEVVGFAVMQQAEEVFYIK